MTEQVSSMNWNGLKPQRFNGGRIHLRQQDQLGSNYEGSAIESLGRKHYDPNYSGSYDLKPHIKVNPERNKESLNPNEAPKKLVYIPQQRKAQRKQLQLFNQKRDERNKFSRQIDSLIEASQVNIHRFRNQNPTTFTSLSQKRMMTFKISQSSQPTQNFDEITIKTTKKMSNKQREKISQQLEDKKVVENLEDWELERSDPNFYIKQRNRSSRSFQMSDNSNK